MKAAFLLQDQIRHHSQHAQVHRVEPVKHLLHGRGAAAPLAFVLLWFYNGERGRCPQWAKWAFYGFYPVHLTMLALVTNLLLA